MSSSEAHCLLGADRVRYFEKNWMQVPLAAPLRIRDEGSTVNDL
jgi:hypothetical protein